LWVFIGLAALSTFGFWALQLVQPINYSLPYSLSFSALTALLAARVGLWVYTFTAEEGQKREWRHDQEMRHFESIYGPFYVDTRSLIEALKRYDLGWMEKFRDVKEGPFWPFVDPDIAIDLDGLQTRLLANSRLPYESAQSAQRTVETATTSYFGAPQEIHGRPFESMRWALTSSIIQDQRFLFDPERQDLSEAHFENLRNAWRQYGPLHDDEQLRGFVHQVKEALLTNPEVQRRAAVCREILPIAEAVHARILRRMKDPFEA
jgi:hypothetical protein